MKVTIVPEDEKDEKWVRHRAENGGAEFGVYEALNVACREWVKQNPIKPGPGSIVRFNDYSPDSKNGLRFVANNGELRDLDGYRVSDKSWEVGPAYYQYTVVYEHE